MPDTSVNQVVVSEKTTDFSEDLNSQEPLVVIIPGTASESNDRYMIDFVTGLWKRYGLKSVVANRRGFCGMKLKGNHPLSWVCYDDLDDILEFLSNYGPTAGRPIYLSGISLGGSYCLSYLALKAEQGKKVNVQATAVVSPCWSFSATQIRISTLPSLDKHIVSQFKEKMYKHKGDPVYEQWVKDMGLTHGKKSI